MSDKLNLLTSNIIRFVAGERPTADKFNAMNLYYTRAIDNICRAIGDMHDRSAYQPLSPQWNPHETGLDYKSLDIANLARLIGPASNLNPKMFGNSLIKEEIISLNSKEYELKYNVASVTVPSPDYPYYTTISTLNIARYNENDDSLIGSLEESEYSILNSRVILFNYDLPSDEYLVVSYATTSLSVEGGVNYFGASFNTIPDPNETSGLKSEISLLADGSGYTYKIDLSDRQIQRQQSGSHDLASSLIEDESEYNFNKTYSLPSWWEQKFNLEGAGPVALPDGLIYLKNLKTNEIYLTAEYAASDIHTLYIRGANLCLEDDHRLILVGTDITTSIDDLRNKMFNHRHDGSFGEPFIRIQDLIGKYVTGEFGPSSIPGNEFPMYLHRKGYQVDDNVRNGNNAMLGDLFMGSPLFSSAGEIESRLASRRVIFGNENASIGLSLGALFLTNDDPDAGIIQIRSAISTTLLSDSNTLTADQNIFNQTNLISDSTNNTEINSNNETHLQIDNDDVITLKKNSEDTSSEDGEVNSFNSRTGSKERTWNSNNRSVFIKSADLEKEDFVIIDFEPSTNSKVVAPTGVLTILL